MLSSKLLELIIRSMFLAFLTEHFYKFLEQINGYGRPSLKLIGPPSMKNEKNCVQKQDYLKKR